MRAIADRVEKRGNGRPKLPLAVAALVAFTFLSAAGWAQTAVPPALRPSSAAPEQSASQAPDADAQRQQGQLDGAKRELDQIEQALGDAKLDDAALMKLRDRLDPLAQQLASLIASVGPKVDDLNQRVALLAPKSPDIPDTQDSARLREQVTASRDAAVGLLAGANSLQVQAGQLATRIADRRRAAFTERTFQQSPSIISPSLWQTVLSTVPLFGGLLARTTLSWLRGLPAEMDAQKTFELMLAGVLALFVAWPGRRFICLLIRKAEARRPPSPLSTALGAAILAIAGAALPLLAGTLFLDTLDELNIAPPRLLTLIEPLVMTPAWVLAARSIVHALLAPGVPRLRLVSATDDGARTLLRFATAAVATLGIAAIFEAAAQSVGAPISYSVAIKGMASLALSGLLAATLRRAAESDAAAEAACLGPYVDPGGKLGGFARILGWAAAATLTLAAFLGYVAFTWFMAHQMLWAAAIFAVTTIALALINAVAAQMQRRDTAIARFAHLQMGLPERALEQAGALIGGGLKAATLALAVILLLAPWGVESGNIFEALQGVIFGFSVAGVTISISSLIVAAILFAAGVFVTHLLQRWLESEFLPTTRIDAGLRNSIRTGVGYLGIFTAAALSLSVLGLSVERITIVAGALSVGIGFGLQSIVNNFVSGLILLWERPIRVGDWVVVGTEEGIVRRINVRATEIETFDRTAVIVPNSTFISGIVKNKVLSDRTGRVELKVTVAITEDAEAVRDLLMRCARAHPQILKDPAPVVQLKNFNANGIDFELFGFVADVDATGRISSELRFSLLKHLHEQEVAHSAPTGAPLDTRQLEKAFAHLARTIEEVRDTQVPRDVHKRAVR
ncbi:MAG: mechanosensitive ion channel family protein [Hyphomicrobiales bacterium]|nr:mechanosensitive ion channel family protein [Hyphomicrobiales bacterium]MBV9516865.1 mechanosensitive ion channel family protein [Hyphomicrobiales bacterium]